MLVDVTVPLEVPLSYVEGSKFLLSFGEFKVFIDFGGYPKHPPNLAVSVGHPIYHFQAPISSSTVWVDLM